MILIITKTTCFQSKGYDFPTSKVNGIIQSPRKSGSLFLNRSLIYTNLYQQRTKKKEKKKKKRYIPLYILDYQTYTSSRGHLDGWCRNSKPLSSICCKQQLFRFKYSIIPCVDNQVDNQKLNFDFVLNIQYLSLMFLQVAQFCMYLEEVDLLKYPKLVNSITYSSGDDIFGKVDLNYWILCETSSFCSIKNKKILI